MLKVKLVYKLQINVVWVFPPNDKTIYVAASTDIFQWTENWTDILLNRNQDIYSYSEQSESDDDQFISAQKEVGGESLWFYRENNL